LLGDIVANESRPLKDLYGVFQRPATQREKDLTARHVTVVGCRERPIRDKARILLRGIGRQNYHLVAAPTGRGRVSYALAPTGSGGCAAPVLNGLIVAGDIGNLSSWVYGLVPDDIEAVDVLIGFRGRPKRARMGENAFAIEVHGADDDDYQGLILHRRDRTTRRIAFP
jgi:hypothetical protein